MQCTNPIIVPNVGLVPCGKCTACRISKSREWSARLLHELSYWNKSVFLTLTYDNEHLPSDFGLHKEHLQKFWKRLRKLLPKEQKIKYFACGEYGDEATNPDGSFKFPTHQGRCHYHAIVFGLGTDKQSKDYVKRAWRFCDWSLLDDRKSFGTVTYDSCRYVSDYIFKKYNGVLAKEVYTDFGIIPPFKTSSLGLGERFCLDNSLQLSSNMGFTLKGVNVALPRYYLNKLGLKLERQKVNKDFEKLYNYAKSVGLPTDYASLSSMYYDQLKQRALNIDTRIKRYHKGNL